MREVTKTEFKKTYLKLGGGAAAGWSLDYWNLFFENDEKPRFTYLLQEPETPEHSRVFIVTDFESKQYRLFFMTAESEESFCDSPDNE